MKVLESDRKEGFSMFFLLPPIAKPAAYSNTIKARLFGRENIYFWSIYYLHRGVYNFTFLTKNFVCVLKSYEVPIFLLHS